MKTELSIVLDCAGRAGEREPQRGQPAPGLYSPPPSNAFFSQPPLAGASGAAAATGASLGAAAGTWYAAMPGALPVRWGRAAWDSTRAPPRRSGLPPMRGPGGERAGGRAGQAEAQGVWRRGAREWGVGRRG